MARHRKETDTLGSRKIPANALYGIQTRRAMANFPVSGMRAEEIFIRAYIYVKKAAAIANNKAAKLDSQRAQLIIKTCDTLLKGGYWDQFVVDVYQAGAGTSFNMNVNEVITNLALESIGKSKGSYSYLNPNDHANMSQSTNDTFPTAMQISSLIQCDELLIVLASLKSAFEEKGKEFRHIIKSGRTHLQDAVGMSLGDEFDAYASATDACITILIEAGKALAILPIGGTAIGSGVNTPKGYKKEIIKALNKISGLQFRAARNSYFALHGCSPILKISQALNSLALHLTKIANDLRLLSSGPTTGFNEIDLPAVQPGSSIMPGKVNPVMAECLNMICYQVMGNNLTVMMAVQAGQLELNVMMPVMIHNILHSFKILINYLPVFTEKCIMGIEANEQRCRAYYEGNPILVTPFTPIIGYEKAAEVVKIASNEQKPIREILLEQNLVSAEEIDRILKQ